MSGRDPEPSRGELGTSLVGLLLVVLVLGVLTATAIIGVQSMTSSSTRTAPGPAAAAIASSNIAGRMSGGGSPNVAGVQASPACTATADAARSASPLYFANRQSYPSKWSDLTASSPAMYKLPKGVIVNLANPRELDGRGWKLIMSGGGASAPTFACT